jgi:hypothetical protein
MRRVKLAIALVAAASSALCILAAQGGADLSQAGPPLNRRIVPLHPAVPFPADATWVLRSDCKIDGQVEEGGQSDRLALRAREGALTGEYVGQRAQGKDNGSRFTGQITRTAAGAPLLSLRQTDRWYAANYAGRLVAENRFVGCWFDSDGNAGDFELVVERK